MPNKLPLYEWCVIVLFCLILLALASFAIRSSKYVLPPLELSESSVQMIKVVVEGHVAKPGVYQLPLNSILGDLFEKAQPLPHADLSSFNKNHKLREGQIFYVPDRHLINIKITGAVEQSTSLQVLSGTRYCELTNQLNFSQDADLKAISKKKRLLKEGEVIEIPRKIERKKSRLKNF